MSTSTATTDNYRPAAADGDLSLSLQDHRIGMVIPAGARIVGTLELPTGVLVRGAVSGSIACNEGSVVVAEGGHVTGNIEADRIYIEGDVGPPFDGVDDGEPPVRCVASELIAVAEGAQVRSNLMAPAFSIHSDAIKGQLETLRLAPAAARPSHA